MLSLNAYAKACTHLQKLLKDISSNGLQYVVLGDMNTDLNTISPHSEMFLDIFSSPYHVFKNDRGYTYMHHTGSTSNIDHCLLIACLVSSVVHVNEDYRDIDHLPISLTLSLPSFPHANPPKKRKWFEKSNWEKANWNVYLITLASLLSIVRVPYRLLQLSTPCPNKKLDFNIYYLKIISCLKQAEGVVCLLIDVALLLGNQCGILTQSLNL